jgi:dTDP-glucose 4,6-dehydratase
LHAADHSLDLHLRVELLTRDPERFAARQPNLAEWASLIKGDVTCVPRIGAMDAAIHAATPASAAFNDAHPERMRATIVDGMRSVLDRLQPSGEIPLLFTSSGAVYGPQPATVARIPETFWAPNDAIEPRNAYALGKRDAEHIARIAAGSGRPTVRIARLFAFVGPYLPLDAHFAVGNFIGDALGANVISVKGDGLAVRSYMYAADMVSALMAILVRGGPSTAYNVGSEHAVTIAELATRVAETITPGLPITVGGSPLTALPTGAGGRYVPDCRRLRGELGVEEITSLVEGIRRTAAWARDSL